MSNQLIEGKIKVDPDLASVITELSYKNMPPQLVGSSSLRSQKYFGDYDFIVNITDEAHNPKDVYDNLNKILKRIDNDPRLYFIELKLQTKEPNVKKFKYFIGDKFDYKTLHDNFKDLDFMKIDLVGWLNYEFIEISCIYSLNQQKKTEKQKKADERIKVAEDIKNLIKEKKFYKILKRKFLIYKMDKNKIKMRELTDIFNSDLGKSYKIMSNLEAIALVLSHYKDNLTKERAAANLHNLHQKGVNLEEVEKHALKIKKYINARAKELNDNFPI